MKHPLLSKCSAFLFFVCTLFIIPFSSYSQNEIKKGDEKRKMHHEVIDDKYVPVSKENRKTSPAYKFESIEIYTTQVNIDSNGDNIVGDAANETSIAIDPTDPNRMVMGWRQFDDVNNNFRQAGYGFSIDGGLSWTFPGVIDPGVFRSDPVIDFDTEGNFYYNGLTTDFNNNYWCDVFLIPAGGVDWEDGVYAHGGDKQWVAIDRTEGGEGEGNYYTAWNSYFSSCSPGFFTRSTDYAASFEDCTTIPEEPYWGTLAVGAQGELFSVGVGSYGYGISVSKSTNAQDPTAQVIWDFTVPINLNGSISAYPDVNPGGLLGQAWIDVDISNGPGAGNVYVASSVVRSSINDPGDVMFTKSVDGGLTWSNPIRINDDISTSNTQWFGTMSVAPNGRIDIAWLDTRDSPPGENLSALYYSYSDDMGETWSENVILSELFDSHVGWPNQEKMGDYFEMLSDNHGAHLGWANTLNGEQDAYYSYIKQDATAIQQLNEKNKLSLSNYPNPFKNKTNISYNLSEESFVQLEIFDIYGKKVATIVNNNQRSGKYTVEYNSENLPVGIYYCRLNSGLYTETIPLMVVK